MLASCLYWIATRFGDVLGAHLYEGGGGGSTGFGVCVIAITVVYALILPTIFLVPRSLIDSPDA